MLLQLVRRDGPGRRVTRNARPVLVAGQEEVRLLPQQHLKRDVARRGDGNLLEPLLVIRRDLAAVLREARVAGELVVQVEGEHQLDDVAVAVGHDPLRRFLKRYLPVSVVDRDRV